MNQSNTTPTNLQNQIFPNAQEIARRLGGNTRPFGKDKWFYIPCPVHGGEDNNCTIMDGKNGSIVVGGCKSHKCDKMDILNALREEGLVAPASSSSQNGRKKKSKRTNTPPPKKSEPTSPKPSEPQHVDDLPNHRSLHAVYRHQNGSLRAAYRYDHKPGKKCWWDGCKDHDKKHKHIWQVKGFGIDGCYLRAWGSRLWMDYEPPPGNTLVVCEGEKSAETLKKHMDQFPGAQFTPVSWIGGAGEEGAALWDLCAGRSVVLWPDDDDSGRSAMEVAAGKAWEVGALEVRTIPTTGETKKDAADYDAQTAYDMIRSAIPTPNPHETQPTSPTTDDTTTPGPDGQDESRSTSPTSQHLHELLNTARANQNRDEITWENVTKDGAPRANSRSNVVLAVTHYGWDSRLAYNQFTAYGELDGRKLEDHSLESELRIPLEIEADFHPSEKAFNRAIGVVCRANPYHPVRDYLESLSWDRTYRLPGIAKKYFGCKGSQLEDAVILLWLRGAVARVLLDHPVEFSYCPVLSGGEDLGKTTAIRTLAGDWYGEAPQLSTPDYTRAFYEDSRGVWIMESAELGGLHGADVDRLKGWISKTTMKHRIPYDIHPSDFNIQFVMVGTTNDAQFLRDVGNRRYPVLEIVDDIDLSALARDRDQIWAEVVHFEKLEYEETGEPTYIALPQEFRADALAHTDKFRVPHDFEVWFVDWVNTPPQNPNEFSWVHMNGARKNAGISLDNQNVARVLRNLGYRAFETTRTGKAVRLWRKTDGAK